MQNCCSGPLTQNLAQSNWLYEYDHYYCYYSVWIFENKAYKHKHTLVCFLIVAAYSKLKGLS